MSRITIQSCLILFFSFSAFAGDYQPSPVPDGKAQIVFYRYKTIVGGAVAVFFFDVTENYKHLEIEGKDAEQSTDQGHNTETISYSEVKKIAKKIGDKFRIGQFELISVEPGTYYFITTNVDVSPENNSFWNKPLGNTSSIKFPVVSMSVESGKRYFVKSDFIFGKGSSITVPTEAEAYGDLKWEHSDLAMVKDLKKIDIETICSEVDLKQDSIAQMVADYKRFSEMEIKGKKQVRRGNLSIFLGTPLGIVIPVTIGTIVSLSTSETKTTQQGNYVEIQTETNTVPMFIGMALGTGLGTTFLLRGLNLKKKGKMNINNGSFNKKEIHMKLEASCRQVSLIIDF